MANREQFFREGTPPELTDEIRMLLSEKYIELYEKLTGKDFVPSIGNVKERINLNLSKLSL